MKTIILLLLLFSLPACSSARLMKNCELSFDKCVVGEPCEKIYECREL